MYEWHFFVIEKGIRHAAKTLVGCGGPIEADARVAQAGSEQFAKPGKTVCATRDPIGARNRSALESKFDGARCRSCAQRAQRTRASARYCVSSSARLRR